MRKLLLGLIVPLLFGFILVGCEPVEIEEGQQPPAPGAEEPGGGME